MNFLCFRQAIPLRSYGTSGAHQWWDCARLWPNDCFGGGKPSLTRLCQPPGARYGARALRPSTPTMPCRQSDRTSCCGRRSPSGQLWRWTTPTRLRRPARPHGSFRTEASAYAQPDRFDEELAYGALVGMSQPARRGTSRSGERLLLRTRVAARDRVRPGHAGQ